MIKTNSYSVLVSRLLRVLTAVATILVTLFGGLLFWGSSFEGAMSIFPFLLYFFVTASVLLDHFMFGGLCSKDSVEIGFLKTSVHGFIILEDAVGFDVIIKALCTFVVVMAPMSFGALVNSEVGSLISAILMLTTFFMTMIVELFCVIFSRHISFLYLKVLYVSVFGVVLAIGIMIYSSYALAGSIPLWIMITVAVVAAGLAAFESWFAGHDVKIILDNTMSDNKENKRK